MKNLNVLAFLIIVALLSVGCVKKQHTFDDKELINALKISLNDKDLKSRMGVLQENKVKNWILTGNIKSTNTFDIDGRHYRFNDKNLHVTSDSVILYKITYFNKDEAQVSLEYIPSLHYKIFGTFSFKFNDGWRLINKQSGIVDGKF